MSLLPSTTLIENEQKAVETKKAELNCLIIVIADQDDTDLRIDAFKIIHNAQSNRGFNVYPIEFESDEAISLLSKSKLIKELDTILLDSNNALIKISKLIILGHCNYYTIKLSNDDYYNQRFLSNTPCKLHDRYICGMNIKQMYELLECLILKYEIYHISLCCCESGTKKVHLENEILDELDEYEEDVYNKYLNHRVAVQERDAHFVCDSDKQDKHLFTAFKYENKYAKLINDVINLNENLCNDVDNYNNYNNRNKRRKNKLKIQK